MIFRISKNISIQIFYDSALHSSIISDGISLIVRAASAGRSIRSSRYPITGIKSGIDSEFSDNCPAHWKIVNLLHCKIFHPENHKEIYTNRCSHSKSK